VIRPEEDEEGQDQVWDQDQDHDHDHEGGVAEGSEEGKPEKAVVAKNFSLTYVERTLAPGDDDSGPIRFGWTLIPCVLTLTIFPCLDSSQSVAEIMIFDKNGVLRTRYPMRARFTEVVGPVALVFLIYKPSTEQMARNLGIYIANIVKTSKINMEIADRRQGAL
jgi:hypothetical protein